MPLIKTNDAKCRDCYKCVRSCPLKAICINSGPNNTQAHHARVLEESCVQCGHCTVICPQKAKVVENDLEDIKNLLSNKSINVVASVAPSFPVHMPLPRPLALPGLLKMLGFSQVGLTAVGAELISVEHQRINAPESEISSACPAVVNLIEQHYTHLLPNLSPLVSPVIAHGRLLKKQYPGCVVVFIGPCIAKKGEILSDKVKGAVDYALGFKELWEWIKAEAIDLNKIENVEFDGYIPGKANLFPAKGGQLLASSLSTDIMDSDVQTVTGLQNCIDLLNNFCNLNKDQMPKFVEMLACRGGCLGGPCGVTVNDIYSKRQRLLDFYSRNTLKTAEKTGAGTTPSLPATDLFREFESRKVILPVPDEKQIKSILMQSGKYAPQDELNCGSCGFGSCREKAVAVFRGYAEPQMCIPYMRKRAESISNLVLNAMPNAVIIADEDLAITEINPAAVKMFDCQGKQIIGQRLDRLIDPTEFQAVLKEKRAVVADFRSLENGIITRQIIFPLENMAVGIFTDITREVTQQGELLHVKTQTIERAQEVIKKQMTVAQEIAGLLGETTAETKILLNQLIKLMED